jgi:hypothetical protein
MLRVTARGTKTFCFRCQKDGRVDRLMIGQLRTGHSGATKPPLRMIGVRYTLLARLRRMVLDTLQPMSECLAA